MKKSGNVPINYALKLYVDRAIYIYIYIYIYVIEFINIKLFRMAIFMKYATSIRKIHYV